MQETSGLFLQISTASCSGRTSKQMYLDAVVGIERVGDLSNPMMDDLTYV